MDNKKALPPHTYPIAIKIFGLIIAGIFSLALYSMPNILIAGKHMKAGEAFLEEKKYAKAIAEFEYVLKRIPDAENARIAVAIAYFANDNTVDDKKGLLHLEGLNISERDWKKIEKVMPTEYNSLFDTISN